MAATGRTIVHFHNRVQSSPRVKACPSKDQDPTLPYQDIKEQCNITKSSHNQDSAFPAVVFFATRSMLDWFADCRDAGATQHMEQKSLQKNYRPVSPGSWTVSGIGGTSFDVHGAEDAEVTVSVNGEEIVIVIWNILSLPRF